MTTSKVMHDNKRGVTSSGMIKFTGEQLQKASLYTRRTREKLDGILWTIQIEPHTKCRQKIVPYLNYFFSFK